MNLPDILAWSYDHHFSAQASKASAKSILKHLARDFGSRIPNASAVTTQVSAWRKAGQPESTIRRRLAILNKALAVARDAGKIKADPPKLPQTRIRSGRIRFLTDAEEAQLLTLLNCQDHRQFVTFLANTGLRLGEAQAMTWGDITLLNGEPKEVHIWGNKSDRPRTVPLNAKAAQVLKDRRDLKSPWGTLRPFSLYRDWNQAREAMGLKDDPTFVIHALRHTFASRLVQRGVQLGAVKELLGHSSITMTMIYAHLRTQDLQSAVSVLD